MNTRTARWLCVLAALVSMPVWADAPPPGFDFQAPASVEDSATPAALRDLAGRVLPVYQDEDIERYLSNLSALQMVGGSYAPARDTRHMLMDRRRSMDPGRLLGGRAVLFDFYAQAKAIELDRRISFADAFAIVFRDGALRLGDQDADDFSAWAAQPPTPFKEALQRAFDQQRPTGSVTQAQAVELMWSYLAWQASREVSPLAAALGSEEALRRYATVEKAQLRTAAGSVIEVQIVRRKNLTTALPALLEFSTGGSLDEARASAARGYVGIVAHIAGKRLPFVDDGEAAQAVIAWIVQQPWSDGRVGMIGRGYAGFAAWAAAKKLPPALKAIATTDAMAPGIDFPMEGQIVRNSALRWADAFANAVPVTGRKEPPRWQSLDASWYRSGQPYSELAHIAGVRSDIFRTWLSHPSYDRYWQKMIPFRGDYAKIDIPVLSVSGYYASGEVGALYYFDQHTRARADANHTLLIGPYDDATPAIRPAAVLRGYAIDDAAQIDLRELRYQWLDHVFKNATKPALLKDRVNLQLMGSNEWRHAPSLTAMAGSPLRFYLQRAPTANEAPRLSQNKPPADDGSVQQTVSLTDPADAEPWPTTAIAGRHLAPRHAATFVSEPLPQATELAGLLSGQLDFTVNKMDVDLNISIYEQLPGGDYLLLCDPYEFRASYARDRTQRRLLQAGVRQQLPFTSEQLIGRRLQAGSRIVLVLAVNKRPDRQVNYGSGWPVSEEAIGDAGSPLRIKWFGGSHIDLPRQK